MKILNIIKLFMIIILFKSITVDALGFPEAISPETPDLARVLHSQGPYLRDWAAISLHVALVIKVINPTDQSVSIRTCAGVLINSNKVLTAAHCLYIVNNNINDGMVNIKPTIIQNLAVVYNIDGQPILFRRYIAHNNINDHIGNMFRTQRFSYFPTNSFFSNNRLQLIEYSFNNSEIERIDVPPGTGVINPDLAMIRLIPNFRANRIPIIKIPTFNIIDIPYIYRVAYGFGYDRHYFNYDDNWGMLKEIYFPSGEVSFTSSKALSSYKVYRYFIDKMDAGGAFLIGNDSNFNDVTLAGILIGGHCEPMPPTASFLITRPFRNYQPTYCNGYISRIDTQFPWIYAMLHDQDNLRGIRCILRNNGRLNASGILCSGH